MSVLTTTCCWFLAATGIAAAQSTTRSSVDSAGFEGNSTSEMPSISGDGRLVAFTSTATNLVVADTNGKGDVFVHDRTSGLTARASLDSGGNQGNETSYYPAISANGQFIAYYSDASNLVPGDSNGVGDVFLRDLSSGATVRVSVDTGGVQGNEHSTRPAISADGRFIAFESLASNLVSGDTNNFYDVFLHDQQTGQTSRVSVDPNGEQGNSDSLFASVSADGRVVGFFSGASTLVPNDTNSSYDVFVLDRQVNQLTRASVSSSGLQGNGFSEAPSVSADGRYIAFDSYASNLVVGDTFGFVDVFVHDRQTGQTVRANVSSNGAQANSESSRAHISSDGRFVVFDSYASNLAGTDTNNSYDVFVRDMQLGITTRASISDTGVQATTSCFAYSLSSDGRFAAFVSDASNLTTGDTNGVNDVFVRDWFATCWLDADGDGFGDSQWEFHDPQCNPPHSANDDDCNDADATVHPGAPELCNGIDDDCDGLIDEGFVDSYCTAGTTVHGCVPSISGIGTPSSTTPSGFDVVVNQVDGQRMGLIFYGFYPAAVPWAPNSPSYRCVSYPVQRTGAHSSGGTLGQCNGVLHVDFNAWMQANPLGLGYPFVGGQVFYAQGWFRDPGAPKGTNLSDGVRFTLCQ